jgi:hypothetical protein
MSYALSGSTPSPIPSANTPEAVGFEVGSSVWGWLGPGVPWLDANLIVRNVTADQAARQVRDVVRSALTTTGATVDDVRWVEGGFVHVRWRPNSVRPAVAYATSVRDTLLQAAQERLGARSQIVMTRFRVDMPTGQTNLYVYPDAPPPPPPPPIPGSIPAPSTTDAPPGDEDSSSGIVVAVAAVGVLAMLGGVGYYLSTRRPASVRRNRRRRHR